MKQPPTPVNPHAFLPVCHAPADLSQTLLTDIFHDVSEKIGELGLLFFTLTLLT